jgi:hypothetical protein
VGWRACGGVIRGCRTQLPREREAKLTARTGSQPGNGVCTLRGRDGNDISEREFGLTYGAYDLLERLGYSCLTPRPLHEKSDPPLMAQEDELATKSL